MTEYIYTDKGMPDGTCEMLRRFYRREEIVRCRDCKHCVPIDYFCRLLTEFVTSDGFCAWGERKRS